MLKWLSYRWHRMTNRRALRAERRGRPHGDFTDAANKAQASNWDKGGFFTK
jgi:hypothetical protein